MVENVNPATHNHNVDVDSVCLGHTQAWQRDPDLVRVTSSFVLLIRTTNVDGIEMGTTRSGDTA